MELLPIVIIVSLLGFFIVLTLVLFTWQFLRARQRRKKRRINGEEVQYKPTRKLTLQSGKAVPSSQKVDTASTRDPYSLDLTAPMPTFTTPSYTVTCVAEPKPSKHRPLISAQDHGHPPILTESDAQVYKQTYEKPGRIVSEPNRPKEKKNSPRIYSAPAKLAAEQTNSQALPRPALVNIESRRPSTTRSSKSQPRREAVPPTPKIQPRKVLASEGQAITRSLQKAYQSPKSPRSPRTQAPELPAAAAAFSSTKPREKRRTQYSIRNVDSPAESSRAVSESIQRPAPLFSTVSYSPRVKFAPPVEVNYGHVSFLSMTDSASSSITSGQVSPISSLVPPTRAPPPSTIESPHYDPSPAASHRASPNRIRDTPPFLETPDFGRMSFFDSGTSSSDEPKSLNRGVSVMSNRSNFTIASSEISSSKWTFGNAKVINIYPSVAQEDDRHTPPYASKLRSKYGQYPRGRRNKALPVVPRSPLWQSEFESV